MEEMKQQPQKSFKNMPGIVRKGAFVLAGALLLVVGFLLWYTVPVMGGNGSQACVRCHDMTPEYLTWKQSNHAQFQCRDCHYGKDAGGFMKYQEHVLTSLFAGDRENTKTMGTELIPDSVCLKCHSENRKYSPSSDTIIPHKTHKEKGIQCVECHSGVAHGRIAERGVVEQIPAEEWNDAVAAEQMDFNYTTPRMDICLDCHGERKVTTTCSVCHSSQVVPSSHKAENWMDQHGINAKGDFKPCNLCHSYTLKKSVDLTKINVSEYINNNTFCYNCHLTKPPGHQGDFRKVHGQQVKEKGMANCQACHAVKAKDAQNANPVKCNDCHWFQ